MIKKLRNRLSMSQAELGEKLGMSQGAISHYETGRTPLDKPMADKLIELAETQGISLTYNEIFCGEIESAA